MANFDMDSYLAQRFAGVGANKLAELDKARADKIAGLQQFRQNIAANSANILAEKEAQANSWVGQTGLDPNSFSGEAVNLAAEGWSGLSRLVGTGVSAVPGLEARRIEGQLASDEYQATATPDQVKALETRAVKARQAEVNITEAFNRSDIIDQTDRNKLQQELKAGFADPWKQYTEGGQRVYDGDLAGAGDIVSGMARLLYTGVKGAVDNPRAALGYAVENTPQLAVGALPKVGGALLAGSNMSYGNELYSRGIENYRQANNGAMPPDDELRSMALHAASAVAAEQAGDMFSLGSAKGVAKEVSRAGFKESLKNIGSVTGKNYLSEGATEGYQTYAEGQATGDKVTAADIFTGAAIGAMSGAQMAGSARALNELTQTTPEAQERKLKSAAEAFQEKADFAAMAKANDPSTLLDPTARTYDPLKAVGVLFEHAKAADTSPEVKQANLLKARELVQNLEATQERNVRVLDIASTPSALSEAKEELVSLKEQRIATDPDNKPRVAVLDQQIALREEAIALSADKVALKRLSGEVKRSEQQLSSTKTLQENFADSIRKNATVDEVATHIAKATRPMSADNMPDIEESRQSVQALVNIAMVSPNSISVEDANNLVSNKNSALTPEQRDYFRQFSEARIAENNLMNLDKVHQAIFTGTAQDTGIVEYRRTIGQALEAGDQKAAEKSLLALQTFAQNHAEKQGIATKLFSSIRVSGDKQVLRVKTGGWEVVPAGKPLKDDVVKANGGFKIHPNSGEFVGNMQTEVVALNQVVKEQQAAFTLRFGSAPEGIVIPPIPVATTATQAPSAGVAAAKGAAVVGGATQTNTEAASVKIPESTRYQLTQSPAYEGLTALSIDDANFELEVLSSRAAKGKLTPDIFAQSEIGKRLDANTIGLINTAIKSDPVAAIAALQNHVSTPVTPANTSVAPVQKAAESVQVAPVPPTVTPPSDTSTKVDMLPKEHGAAFTLLQGALGGEITVDIKTPGKRIFNFGDISIEETPVTENEDIPYSIVVSDLRNPVMDETGKFAFPRKEFTSWREAVAHVGSLTGKPVVQSKQPPQTPSSNLSVAKQAEGTARPDLNQAVGTEDKTKSNQPLAGESISPVATETVATKKAEPAAEINLLESLDAIKTGVSSVGAAKFAPNKEQAEGIAKIQDFLNTPNGGDAKGNTTGNIFVLEGKAGTGKTSLVQEAVAEHLAKGGTVTVAAISHKAKGLLQQKLTKFVDNLKKTSTPEEAKKIGNVQAFSVAKLLGMRMNWKGVFEKPKGFTPSPPPIEGVTLLVVDEASMMDSKYIATIEKDLPANAKLIYIGDRGQVEPIEKDESLVGKISQVFSKNTGGNKHSLVVRVRQGEDSSILPYADHYWNNSEKANDAVANPVPDTARQSTNELIMMPEEGWISKVIPLFLKAKETGNANLVKVVAFNNLESLNTGSEMLRGKEQQIREAMFGKNPAAFNIAEQLVMTDSFGSAQDKEGVLENGTELVVESVSENIGDKATKVPLVDGTSTKLHSFNLSVKDLVTGDIKNILVLHPKEKARFAEIVKAWEDKKNATWKSSETKEVKKAVDGQFAALKRGLFVPASYAYIRTAHTAQGSTYDVAVVLEDNIANAGSPSTVSRLMYTAITRASKLAVIVSSRNEAQVTVPDETVVSEAANEMPTGDDWFDASMQEGYAPDWNAEEYLATTPLEILNSEYSNNGLDKKGNQLPNTEYRALSDSEKDVAVEALKELQAFYPLETDRFSFVAQSGYAAAGTIFDILQTIAINSNAFLFRNNRTTPTQVKDWVKRIMAHELAHARDFITGYKSDSAAAYNKGGSFYEEALAALGSNPAAMEEWFQYIFAPLKDEKDKTEYEKTLDSVNIQHELYAQFHAMYIINASLMQQNLPGIFNAFSKIYPTNSGAVDETGSGSNAQGSTGVGQKSPATPDASTSGEGTSTPLSGPEGTAAVKGQPAGQLDALTATPEVIKAEQAKPYDKRNFLLAHFSQATAGVTAATQRPLVMVKNFMSSLDKLPDFSAFLKDTKLTDKQLNALTFFRDAALGWRNQINQYLVKGDNGPSYKEGDERFFYRNPLNWLMTKTPEGNTELEENATTAIVYGALTLLQELADATPTNSQKTLNAILARDEDAPLPAYAYELLGTVGTRDSLVHNSTGKTVVSALGMKADGDVGQNVMTQLQGGFGVQSARLLLSLGLIEKDTPTFAEIRKLDNLLAAMGNPDAVALPLVTENGKPVTGPTSSFFRIARDEQGNLSKKVQDILNDLRGANNIIDKLMSVETHLVYPSLEKQVFTQKTTKPGQKIPSLLKEVNQQNGEQETLTRKDHWKVLHAISVPTLNALAGVVKVDPAKVHISKRKGLEAKNQSIMRDLDKYDDFVNDNLVEKGELTDKPFYLGYSVQTQQRVGESSNVINQQASKTQRPLFYRKAWEAVVDLTELDNFYMRVAEGFGYKSERTGPANSLEKIIAQVNNPVIRNAVAILQGVIYDGTTKLTPEEELILIEATAMGKNQFATLDALLALAHKAQAEDTGQPTFVTHLHASVDGVANGTILAQSMFGAGQEYYVPATDDHPDYGVSGVTDFNDIVARGGIYTADTFTSFGEYKDAGVLNRDTYEHGANTVIAGIAESLKNKKQNSKEVLNTNAVTYFIGSLGVAEGAITSAGRDALKPPITQMMYGAGIPKTIKDMSIAFIDQIYDVFEKSVANDPAFPKAEVIKQVNVMLATNGSKVRLSEDTDLLTYTFDGVWEIKALSKAYRSVFEAPITETVEQHFDTFRTNTAVFHQAVGLADGLYTAVYDALKKQKIASLLALGVIPKGNEKEAMRDLSKVEEGEIVKRLEGMFPTMRTLLSIESSTDEAEQYAAGIRLGTVKETATTSQAYTTQVKHKPYKAGDTKESTVHGLERSFKKVGVRMLAVITQSVESYISHMTQKGRSLSNTHDSVHGGLDTIHEATRAMNQNTFHALLNYSPLREAQNTLTRTLAGLTEAIRYYETSLAAMEQEGPGIKATVRYTHMLEEQALVMATIKTFLLDFAKESKMEGVAPADVIQVVMGTTQDTLVKVETRKLKGMSRWAYLGQYALEHTEKYQSSYEITPKDTAAVLEKLNELKNASELSATVQAELVWLTKALSNKFQGATTSPKPKQKPSVDNMPDLVQPLAPRPEQTYSTQDIYNALNYNPVSASFDTHLREVLTNIVEKLHGAFGSFKEAMAQSTTESASALFAEAVTTGKAPLTFSLLGSGIKFNDQQAFVAEQVHATILAALDNTNGNKSAVYNELSKLFRETRTRLKDSAWAKDPATAGLYDRIFNQIPADTEGRSNYLAEFAALGLAHEEFNALLKVPTKMEAAVFADTTILGVLKRLFAKILETFNGRVTGTVPGQQADKKLNALITKLVLIENKRKAVLEAERKGLLKFIDKQMGDLREVKKGAISKIANSPKFMKNKNVFIGAASGVVATVADSQVGLFFRNIEKVRNANFDGRSGMVMGFLGEMNGPKPMIQKLLRTIKHFEGQRKKIITMTGKFVLQGFDNQGKHLEDFDKRALTKVLLHTGAHSLLDHFDTDKLLTLLKDPKALAAEIAVFEQQLTGYTAAQEKYFVEQSRSLGYWMVTGKFTHELPMKNADNIARGFMSGTKHTLTEAQIATAKVTLDALSSLYALSYTDASQTDSVAKSLEQELARPDGGNGVRLLLLSHKEMEQQAKERLFSGNEALMIKGYMPEIYNPHTDVKAANQKDGEMLEALGYVAGAAVSNDPADFDPEAKRLYTLRDGAIMPWLSGIFSFTGMRAKGTKHHGKFANRTQQAITQDKLAAIQARSPSESGYNFDPRQVKDSHMAPLMNSLGQAVNYQYMMHNDTKDNLLERDTRFDSVMGALNGSIYDKENSAVHNKKSVEVFFKEFDEGYTKEPRAFLEVSATSTDPELRDIYKMLPQTTKDAIREIWGKDAMMVRVSHLDIAFGYRKQSLSTSFDKEKEDRNLIEKAMVPLTLTVLHTVGKFKGMSDAEAERFTKRAGVYVRRGEDVWKAVVQETKDIIVVKSGVATMSNIASNLLLLKLYGVGTVTGLKDMQIAWVGARDYDRDSKKLFELETLIASKATTTGLADLNLQVRELKDALARNPVRKLIDEGLMPTIVEDVSEDEDIYGFKSRIVRSTEKYTSKLNKTVVAAGKQMYMTHDTQMYKGMAQLTQLSDFVARYALYQHLTTRTDNPIPEKVAIQEASDAFINYDVPMQRDIQYLDDMGILPFTKYFLRIQRVIRGRFRHAPGKVALMLLAQGYMDWLPSPLDSSIFFKIGNNPMNWGALQFPGVLDELATYKAATSLFK